ncbi:hypothetical protein Pmar_PMAR003124 [Perkinsus marinus ATCC 50983]|uniref:Uncharacterized protein n=1 Tax=Perkinsus marinus (strain ATCC 50983 / TXsc) TaxID=423536 RepID=C5L2Y9_PERM5|nr:hypothetical protein Pmar_PMAR003124 [Perkinsus marinus ATCC 50983]EER08876.1 hypothetical protein Pmar_PMAR003124 [Perkinsus marinus ATCC 50983]|eukprot:XP_002777060.1 hypothetical protein Pmar_PMAR003124 [Perkinsus marinus ATCC 50983]
MRVPGSTPVHHRTIVTPTVPAARGKGKGNGKGKGTTAPGPNRTALEKAKKANKKACVVELRSVDDAAKMDAAEFMTFRSRALGLLSGSVIVSTTFPIKGGIGLVLSDESHGNTCVQSLSRMQGYTAKVRTGLWPRVILFNPAIARGSTIDSVSRSIKEGNPALTEGIDGDKLVSAVYWRGQHLVMAICPTLYHRLSANGEGKGRLDQAKIRCTRCAAFGHERQACTAQSITGPVLKCANCLDFNASHPEARVHRKGTTSARMVHVRA